VFFPENSSLLTPETIRLGDDVFIGEGAHFSGDISVGNRVLFGPRVMALAGNHLFAVSGESVRFLHPRGEENSEPIAVEDEVWCGAGVILLGGARLGMGCVVGAGSIVTNGIPPYVVAVGNPCRPVRLIFDDDGLADHLTRMGYGQDNALEIVRRRTHELAALKPGKLKAIDRTAAYREIRQRGNLPGD